MEPKSFAQSGGFSLKFPVEAAGKNRENLRFCCMAHAQPVVSMVFMPQSPCIENSRNRKIASSFDRHLPEPLELCFSLSSRPPRTEFRALAGAANPEGIKSFSPGLS
jgi:hypothetical protein